MYKSIIKPMPFCYATEIVTVPANGSLTPQINFANDSDFILDEIRQTKLEDNGAQLFNSLLVQFRMQAGESLSNTALDTQLFAEGFNGKKMFGVEGLQPRIPANSALDVILVNNTAADIVHQVQLWGYKVEKLY